MQGSEKKTENEDPSEYAICMSLLLCMVCMFRSIPTFLHFAIRDHIIHEYIVKCPAEQSESEMLQHNSAAYQPHPNMCF